MEHRVRFQELDIFLVVAVVDLILLVVQMELVVKVVAEEVHPLQQREVQTPEVVEVVVLMLVIPLLKVQQVEAEL
jgi:hypothetical protein